MKMQEELATLEVEGSAGDGMVRVKMNGQQEVIGVKLKPQVVDPEEIELLEDLLTVAMKDALEKSKALSAEKMGKLAGGLGLPPGFF